MDIKELDERIKSFLATEKEPIVVVVSEICGTRKSKTRRKASGGVLSFWDGTEGRLMLNSKCPGSEDVFVRVPEQIYHDDVISIKMLNVQDLIDNTVALYWIREEIERKIS